MQNFICINCKKEVTTTGNIGTHQRNHCPYCLYSMHVDDTAGDRQSHCHGKMIPIGLTFKHEGEGKIGELMFIHLCEKCGKISINRLAGDDDVEKVLLVFEDSFGLDESLKIRIQEEGIQLAGENDKKEIKVQLFGK